MKPRVLMTLGDAAGIGPELVAKLLSLPDVRERAEIVVLGDEWLWRDGREVAGVEADVAVVDDLDAARFEDGRPVLLRRSTLAPSEAARGEASAACGRSVIALLGEAVDLARDGRADAICFAPLNKGAMKQGGLPFNDELHFFADRLGHDGPLGELNTLDGLWTTRVTSHMALKDVAANITGERVGAAIDLARDTLLRAGVARPRLAVCGVNPHAGDGGLFGREEIDVIAPAVERARRRQIAADGPFPADTVFLKARDGLYDAVVTMYHDQGQIALKLMGFERGVTVQGGLPLPITTPAHGTAYDIAGKGVAKVEATRRAFLIACDMGRAHRAARAT